MRAIPLLGAALVAATALAVWLILRPSGGTGSAAVTPGETSPQEASQFTGYPLL